MDWFERLTGFREGEYEETRARLKVEDRRLRSLVKRLSLATRSDLSVEAQVAAPGATWIDPQLLAKESALSGGGFGADVREAMECRIAHLVEQGLARRQGQRFIFARDLLNTLRRRDLVEAAAKQMARQLQAHAGGTHGVS
jgi:hypothetical protein